MSMSRLPAVVAAFAFTFAVALTAWMGSAACGSREQRVARAPHASAPIAAALVPATPGGAAKALAAVPVAFVPNRGQWHDAVAYAARFRGGDVLLGDDGWTLLLHDCAPPSKLEGLAARALVAPPRGRATAVRMAFPGARSAALEPQRPLPGVHHYLVGNDRSRWRNDVPRFAAVRYRELLPGVDVLAREHVGHFEFDLLLRHDADLAAVEVDVDGARTLAIAADGSLLLTTALGALRLPQPLTWQQDPQGSRTPVACRYEVRGARTFGFVAPGRRGDCALVVDPAVLWSTTSGQLGSESIRGVALAGDILVAAGTTAGGAWTPFVNPATVALDASSELVGDAFVARLDAATGQLASWTTLGGWRQDGVSALALDAAGGAVIAGSTYSWDLPVTPGVVGGQYTGNALFPDGFVARLDPTAANLVYCTYLTGGSHDGAWGVAVNAQDEATVVGTTASTNFQTTVGPPLQGPDDAFVCRLTPTANAFVFSRLLGGSDQEGAYAVAVDAGGDTVVVGETRSSDFPVTPGAVDPAYSGNRDAFVTRLDATGATVRYSTYLGGTAIEAAFAVQLDRFGDVTVAGATQSAGFPTTPGAFDTTFNGPGPNSLSYGGDAFVVRLSTVPAAGFVFATLLGGSGIDAATAIALAPNGDTLVAGGTLSLDFPTMPGAHDQSPTGADGFVARLDATGSHLAYCTLLGGRTTACSAIAVTPDGGALVAGTTTDAAFPAPATSPPIATAPTAAFLARLTLLPTGAVAFGASTSGCGGPIAIGVGSMPQVGNAAFALTCANAPPARPGVLAVATGASAAPVPFLGAALWLAPGTLVATAAVTGSARHGASVAVPIPQNGALAGVRFHGQFLWLEPAGPPPCPASGVAASNALEVTVQP
jgi:hypothetical protein